MDYEIEAGGLQGFQETWPGEFNIFSPLEFACGIPQVLFAITTLKANGKPNVCFHSWSCFQGEGAGYFAIMAGLLQRTHTYANILRDKMFCVNFLSQKHYGALLETIEHNAPDSDEFATAGFHAVPGRSVAVPRIAESFLCLECTLEQEWDLSGTGLYATVIGRVTHMAVKEKYGEGIDARYGPEGFMFNVHSPRNLRTGKPSPVAVASLRVDKTFD